MKTLIHREKKMVDLLNSYLDMDQHIFELTEKIFG